ncbi:MAG: PEP-CTERM sorting domain-containing protein [Akkermansiaceae bacterium]|jgi:hypothetical protein
MRIKLILGILFCCVTAGNSAVTITFSNSSTGALSNFENATGTGSGVDILNTSNRLVWGILVDAAGDGFDGISSAYDDGFSLAADALGISLNLHNGTATDDVLYIASPTMASSGTAIDLPSAGEVPANQNRILTFSNLTYGGAVAAGDTIAIMWFNVNGSETRGIAASGLDYGIYLLPNVSYGGASNANVLPVDGATYTFASAFAGIDTAKTMDFQLGVIPEPSTFLLASLGVLGLLRRRR